MRPHSISFATPTCSERTTRRKKGEIKHSKENKQGVFQKDSVS
jgi:hypothetical protein